MTSLNDLSYSNRERQKVWGGSEEIDLSFRGMEIGGEVGELQNKMKKLVRHRKSITGNTDDVKDDELLHAIGEELADVVICASLIANDLGLDLSSYVPFKFDQTSDKNNVPFHFTESPHG